MKNSDAQFKIWFDKTYNFDRITLITSNREYEAKLAWNAAIESFLSSKPSSIEDALALAILNGDKDLAKLLVDSLNEDLIKLTIQTSWKQLADEFMEVTKLAGGPTKSNSGSLEVTFNGDFGIYVELGAYDIGDYSRHHKVKGSPFQNEIDALKATKNEIHEMREIITEDNSELENENVS